MKYYVYLYSDPRKEPPEPIYVGKGKGNRCLNHIENATNPILLRKIEHIKKEDKVPIVNKIVEELSSVDALEQERKFIAFYGRIDKGTGTLCNLTDGGEGTSGRKVDEFTRMLMSQQRKGKKQTEAQYRANCNRKVSSETREKISKATKGRKLTKEHADAIGRANLGRKVSMDTRDLWSSQRRGKKQTFEHIENMRQAVRAAYAQLTPEEKKHRYDKVRGQKRTEETKQKMREAWIRRKAKREGVILGQEI